MESPVSTRPVLDAPRWLVEAMRVTPDAKLAAFIARFQRAYGEGLVGVVFYGSRRSGAQARRTSLYDFFLIADDYGRFHHSRFHVILNKLAPPNIYHAEIPDPESGGKLGGKYGVVSLARLERECSPSARDHYFLGRFAQKIAVVWARDEEVLGRLAACTLSAARRAVALAAPYLEPGRSLPPRSVARRFLELSYAGDVRIESAEKLDEIIGADPDFYDRLYGEALGAAAAAREPPVRRKGEGFESAISEAPRVRLREASRRFLSRARRHAPGRWLGHLLTFNDPVNYLLAKYERHMGKPVALTPLQRRWPLVFGWPVLFRILRERGRQANRQLEK